MDSDCRQYMRFVLVCGGRYVLAPGSLGLHGALYAKLVAVMPDGGEVELPVTGPHRRRSAELTGPPAAVAVLRFYRSGAHVDVYTRASRFSVRPSSYTEDALSAVGALRRELGDAAATAILRLVERTRPTVF